MAEALSNGGEGGTRTHEANAADLQSAPFAARDTSPYSSGQMVGRAGFEPARLADGGYSPARSTTLPPTHNQARRTRTGFVLEMAVGLAPTVRFLYRICSPAPSLLGSRHRFKTVISGFMRVQRRRWDSNPRRTFAPSPLARECHKPLGHISAELSQTVVGGRERIRTSEDFRPTRFPSERNRPLCHPSGV